MGRQRASGGVEIDENPPRPPDFLIDRVVSGFTNETAEAGRRSFDRTGQQSVQDIKTALAGIGRRFDDFPRILDFGCGCARVDRWLQYEATSSELHACDIDEQAIAWNQANLPGIQFARNDHEPPLPYADETFDLLINHSVFTHIDEQMQDVWLAELHRVLKPGGIALLSVHGPRAFAVAEDATLAEGDTAIVWRRELERAGILFIGADGYVGSSFPDFYHTTYHAPWYVLEHWSQWFTVLGYLQKADLGFQDIVLLERDSPESRVRPIASAGGATGSDGHEAIQSLPASTLADISQARISPVVAEAFQRLGERVSRLEAALADKLS
jgi:SAM-dependent methyltransferase